MTSSHESLEAQARAFASRFGERAFAEATDLLGADGGAAVVEWFPDEYREGPLEPDDALDEYWWGLYGQYGEFECVEDVAVDDVAAWIDEVVGD